MPSSLWARYHATAIADPGSVSETMSRGSGEKPDAAADRLAAKLRENLARRKAQQRARRSGGADTSSGPSPSGGNDPQERTPPQS